MTYGGDQPPDPSNPEGGSSEPTNTPPSIPPPDFPPPPVAGSDPGTSAPGPAPGMPPPPPPPGPPPVAATPPMVAHHQASASAYPIDVGVETPDPIARWRPLVQWILAIPLFIVLYLYRIVAEILAVVGWFIALVTGQLPVALGDVIAGYYRYAWRAYSYAWFLRDQYPPFGPAIGYSDPGNDPAWFEVRRGSELSRLKVLFRIILVIPQLIVIFFLLIALYVVMVIAFFAVLFTGRWPAGLRNFVVGVGRWLLRVDAWLFLLADPYPPFSLA